MRKPRHHKKVRLTGLFFLTAFVNLYLVQLSCNLPHLVQRLESRVSTPVDHHGAAERHSHSHSHTPGRETPRSTHSHHSSQLPYEHELPAPLTADTACCAEQEYAPFVKAFDSTELSFLVKAHFPIVGSLCKAVLSFLYKSPVSAVSHAPPDAPFSTIPDIRIFLHSLII